MSWPFISRSTFDEVARQRDELKRELATAHDDLKRLNNFLVWRTGGGVAPDTSLLPESYQPKASIAPKATEAPAGMAPGKHRDVLGKFEANQEAEYRKSHPVMGAIKIVEKQEEAG